MVTLGEMKGAQVVHQHVKQSAAAKFRAQLGTFNRAQLRRYLKNNHPKIAKHHQAIYGELMRRSATR